MFNCMICGREITEDFYQKYDRKCYECIQKECLNYGLNYAFSICIGIIGLIIIIFFFTSFFITFLINPLDFVSFLYPGLFFLLGISFFVFSVKGLKKRRKLNFHQK